MTIIIRKTAWGGKWVQDYQCTSEEPTEDGQATVELKYCNHLMKVTQKRTRPIFSIEIDLSVLRFLRWLRGRLCRQVLGSSTANWREALPPVLPEADRFKTKASLADRDEWVLD